MSNSLTTIQSDPFWLDNLDIIFHKDRLTEFFPSEDMTFEEKLNALMRFGLYLSVLLFLYTKNGSYFYILIGITLLTYFIYSNQSEQNKSSANHIDKLQRNALPDYIPKEIETLQNSKKQDSCTKPTLENPFMNYTMGDRLDHENGVLKDKLDACDINDPDIKKQSDQHFHNNLFNDVSEVWGKLNSQRQFYSMPWSGPAPDLNGDFKNWLYKRPPTFKETSQLNNYVPYHEDLRHNKMPFAVYEETTQLN